VKDEKKNQEGFNCGLHKKISASKKPSWLAFREKN